MEILHYVQNDTLQLHFDGGNGGFDRYVFDSAKFARYSRYDFVSRLNDYAYDENVIFFIGYAHSSDDIIAVLG